MPNVPVNVLSSLLGEMMAARKPKQTAADRRSAAEHLITRVIKTECRKCQRPILSGHVWGEPTRIERVRLNRAGELSAILLGLKTFEERHGTVMKRRGWHIAEGMPKYSYVMAEHRCEHRWPAQHFDLREIFPRYQGEEPPF